MDKQYTSTRNGNIKITDQEAILRGLAEDGGLFVYDGMTSKKLPLKDMMDMDYMQMAEVILHILLPSFTLKEIKECVKSAYEHSFKTREITPLVKVKDDYILELFHGPTCAFKDVGLQMLPQLMKMILNKRDDHRIMILTATSGDTGKAALKGFQDVENIGITVFYPNGKVSEMQKLQMITQEGKNTVVCAIEGNFDDAQSAVKEIFHNEDIIQALKKDGVILSSANSINIGRLIPQIVYYVYAYKCMVNHDDISFGEEVNFCVPTGNFGNVLAGYYAKMMGLPVHKFIVASNENNVLYDFFQKGYYDRKRPFHKTMSPSMDILISSNLERLLYYMSDGDHVYINDLMKQLKEEGSYQIDEKLLKNLKELFYVGYAKDKETSDSIHNVFKTANYIMDPHTAVGYKVMKEYQKIDTVHKCILLSTASPYKFAPQVCASLYHEVLHTDEFELMNELSKKTKTKIPNALNQLKGKEIRHHDVIEKNEIADYVMKKTKEVFL